MSWFTGAVLYVLIWWTALFAVLPFWTSASPDAADTPGGWRGAPTAPRIGLKAFVTTVVAAVLWCGCYLLIDSGWVSFRSGWWAMPNE